MLRAPNTRPSSSGTLSSETAHQNDTLPSYGTDTDAEKASAEDEHAEPAAPDGGLVAWLVVLGAWCTLFCSFGWINSMFSEIQHKKGVIQR